MAEQDPVGEIQVTPRTMRIGPTVYALGHIARVQTFWGRPAGRIVSASGALVFVVAFAAIQFFSTLSSLGNLGYGYSRSNSSGLIALLVVTAIVIVGVRAWLLRPRPVLLVEASGGQFTELVGKRLEPLMHLKEAIVAAIENPPSHPQFINVDGDVVFGPKNTQYGNGNNLFSGR